MLVAFLLATCSSCIESTNPASSPDTASVDKRLIGFWVDTDNKQHWIAIGKNNLPKTPKGVMTGVSAELTKDGAFDGGPITFFVTKLGSNTYANVPQAQNGEMMLEGVKSYSIIKYTVTDDVLTMILADDRFVKKEVEAGRIKGMSATITDSTENLATWIAVNDERLFPSKDVLKFNRLKSAPE
jgi:hypothetical protein